MRIKYIGKTTDFSGKPLWEILGNLKNFGVGRLVKRHMFDRYPEPCFYRIVKVEAVPLEKDKDRRVRAWVEKVFRGRRYPELVEVCCASYKADFRLIPKTEEKDLWEKVNSFSPQEKLVPQYISFPPLLSEMIKEEMQENGLPVEEPKLKLKICSGIENFYRLSDDEKTVLPSNSTSDCSLYKTE